jgi:N-acetylneuraminic acid mutarotase
VTASTPGGGTLTYQWYVSTDGGSTFNPVASGGTSVPYAAPAVSPAQTYYVTVGNQITSNGTSYASSTVNSAVTTVTFYQRAAITTQPPATTAAVAGSPVSIAITPAALVPATFPGTVQTIQWYKGLSQSAGTAIVGATSATLSFPSVAGTDTNNYWAVVTNSLPGASSSASSTVTSTIAKLSVNTLPTIVSQPPAAPIAAEGTSFSLTVNAVGAPNAALSYQWQKGGADIPGATSATYTLASPSAATDVGSYRCVITSSVSGTPAQTMTAGPYSLRVNQKPTFSGPPTVSGSTAPITLTVNAANPNSGSFLTYAWKRNGTAITGAVLPTYTINEVTSSTAGNYTCDVSSVFPASGNSNVSTVTATSPIATVTVGAGLGTPVVTFGSSPCTTAAGVTTCSAGMTGITASTASVPDAITYDWSVTNGSITAGNGTPFVTVTAGTNTALPMTISVAVSNGSAGAVGSASATVVPAITQAKILAPARVHPGDAWMKASIDNQAGATYGWTLAGPGSITGPSTGLALPFSANSLALNGDSITLNASVTNGADPAPTAGKTVSVTTGTWIGKDGGLNWMLGAGSAAAVFANGRVLVCGGVTLGSFTPAAAAIYDPATRRWTRVADMNYPRTGHTATALQNGTILVTGGSSGSSANILNNAEVYDPIWNTWTVVPTNMGPGRVGHAATLLATGVNAGSVVISGGRYTSSDFAATITLFRPFGAAGANAGGTFVASTAGLNVPRAGHTATALNDGRVLIVGGSGVTVGGVTESYQQAEIFDATASSSPSAWTITRLGSLTTQQRAAHTATVLPGGTVLITGGSQSGATAETFDPATGTFTATAGNMIGGYVNLPSTSGRAQHAAILLTTGPSAGKVLITGGGPNGSSQGAGQSAELYDPSARTFTGTPLVAPMNAGRYGHNAVALTDGTIMMLGGNSTNSSLTVTASTEIYDPVANTWTLIGAPGRSNATLTLLPSGKVMLVGGQGERSGIDRSVTPYISLASSATAHLYDPATGTWTDAASVKYGRYNHSAVLVTKDGKRQLLVAGGMGPNSPALVTNTAEIYDPSTNTWASAGTMMDARQNFGMIELPNGKVLAMGGSPTTGPNLSTSEIYDPATNSWAYTSDGSNQTYLTEVKASISPILLKTGMVAVAGGNIDSNTFSSMVELFDYTTQTWTALPTALNQGRVQHLSVALPDGPHGKGRFVLLGGKIPGGINGLPAGGTLAGNAIEVYDTLAQDSGGNQVGATVPTANSYFKTEARTYPGANIKVAMLPGGRILLTPETLNATTGASTTEIYDPAFDTLIAGPVLTAGQGGMSGGAQGFNLGFDSDGNPLAGDVMLYGGSQSDTFTQIYRP